MKLDQCSTYNLILIREWGEWKIMYITRYEYLVMSCGLVKHSINSLNSLLLSTLTTFSFSSPQKSTLTRGASETTRELLLYQALKM